MANKCLHTHGCSDCVDKWGLPTQYECSNPECSRRLAGEVYLHCGRCYSRATRWFQKQAYSAEVSESTVRLLHEDMIKHTRRIMIAQDRKALNRMSRWQRRMLDDRRENE